LALKQKVIFNAWQEYPAHTAAQRIAS
jgi:hypothetical protein